MNSLICFWGATELFCVCRFIWQLFTSSWQQNAAGSRFVETLTAGGGHGEDPPARRRLPLNTKRLSDRVLIAWVGDYMQTINAVFA